MWGRTRPPGLDLRGSATKSAPGCSHGTVRGTTRFGASKRSAARLAAGGHNLLLVAVEHGACTGGASEAGDHSADEEAGEGPPGACRGVIGVFVVGLACLVSGVVGGVPG